MAATQLEHRQRTVDAGGQQTRPQKQHQLATDGGEAFHHLPLEGRAAPRARHEGKGQQWCHQGDHRQDAEIRPDLLDQQHQQGQGHRQSQSLQPQRIAGKVRHPSRSTCQAVSPIASRVATTPNGRMRDSCRPGA